MNENAVLALMTLYHFDQGEAESIADRASKEGQLDDLIELFNIHRQQKSRLEKGEFLCIT